MVTVARSAAGTARDAVRPVLKFQAFVFNWVGHERRATELERIIGAVCPVTVINSESSAEARHPGWCHIGEDAYFTAQWNAALERFDADVMLHVQADASSRDFPQIVERCRHAMENLNCGVYAPNVDYTPWVFHRNRLQRVEPDLYEVPQTDCTCWAISREVLDDAPRLDPAQNKYGWGIDFLVIATARRLQRRVLRDYRFKVDHVWRGSGYDLAAAGAQIEATMAALPPELREQDRELRREAEAKLGLQPWPRRLRDTARKLKRSLLR